MSILLIIEIFLAFFALLSVVSEVIIPLVHGQKFFPTIRWFFGSSTQAEKDLRTSVRQSEEVRTIQDSRRLNDKNIRILNDHDI